jgi:hypothetical protein
MVEVEIPKVISVGHEDHNVRWLGPIPEVHLSPNQPSTLDPVMEPALSTMVRCIQPTRLKRIADECLDRSCLA